MSHAGLRLTTSKASRTVSSNVRIKSRSWTRRIHRTPKFPFNVDEGLGEFLPPAALKTVAVDYHGGLLQRLNEEVKNTENRNQTLVQTIVNTSTKQEDTLAFNYASLALNNGFFLENLKAPPPAPAQNHQEHISSRLSDVIREQHGSLTQLKSAFGAAASGMFTSGWVWFVTDKSGNTGILPTFGAGTLLIRSRSYMAVKEPATSLAFADDPYEASDATDADTPSTPLPQEPFTQPQPTSQYRPPSAHPYPQLDQMMNENRPSIFDSSDPSYHNKNPVMDKKADMLNIGSVLHPLFCISVSEHAWMSAGYGVWGKEEWLSKFWSVLDWSKVSKAYDHFVLHRVS